MVLKKYNGQEWGKEIEISDTGCYLQPSLAGDLDGGLWICWPARVKDNWDIYTRHYKDGRWSATFRLCNHPGPDTNQHIIVEENNRLWVAWQGFGSENANIFMRSWDKGKWSSIIKVTDHKGNDWQPAIATDNKGNIYLAWDTYRNRRHTIILRQFNADASDLGPEIEVFSTKNYVVHASLTADKAGKVWIAWDMSGGDWCFGEEEEQRFIEIGKFESVETQINYNKTPMEDRRGRYNSRKIGLLCYYGGKFYKPSEDLYIKLPPTMKIYADLPQLQIDSNGRLWLFFHHYTGSIPFYILDKLKYGRFMASFIMAKSGLPRLSLDIIPGVISLPLQHVPAKKKPRFGSPILETIASMDQESLTLPASVSLP